MNHIIEQGLHDRDVRRRAVRELRRPSARTSQATPSRRPPASAASRPSRSGAPPRCTPRARPSAIFYTLGITEHTCGTENVQNLANLAMLCGQIGKPSSGVNPLRGQNNVQGGCDMGAIHSVFPGYQKVADPAVREKFAKAWGVRDPDQPGRPRDRLHREGPRGRAEGVLRLRRGPRPQRAESGQGRREPGEAGVPASCRRSS